MFSFQPGNNCPCEMHLNNIFNPTSNARNDIFKSYRTSLNAGIRCRIKESDSSAEEPQLSQTVARVSLWQLLEWFLGFASMEGSTQHLEMPMARKEEQKPKESKKMLTELGEQELLLPSAFPHTLPRFPWNCPELEVLFYSLVMQNE